MKQISSKLNMHMRGITIVNNNIEKLILNIILASFGVLAILYMVFLGTMVKDIVERKSFEASARPLSNEVQNLEITYLSLSNNIDLAFSYSLGFREVQTTFSTQKSLGLGQGGSFGSIKAIQNDL